MIVIVEKNKNGKIELTQEELEKLLKDAYEKGMEEGKKIPPMTTTITTDPWIYKPDYGITTTGPWRHKPDYVITTSDTGSSGK